MSETTVIEQSLPEVLSLPLRGTCAVQYYELYDEVANGADNLFIRCRVNTLSELTTIIKEVLACDNPCATTKGTTNYSLGRYEKYKSDGAPLLPPDKDDIYPKKASNAFKMMVRIKFYNDFGYINLGKKWNPLYLDDGIVNSDYPIEAAKQAASYRFTINDLDVIDTCMISGEDVDYIVSLIKAGAATVSE